MVILDGGVTGLLSSFPLVKPPSPPPPHPHPFSQALLPYFPFIFSCPSFYCFLPSLFLLFFPPLHCRCLFFLQSHALTTFKHLVNKLLSNHRFIPFFFTCLHVSTSPHNHHQAFASSGVGYLAAVTTRPGTPSSHPPTLTHPISNTPHPISFHYRPCLISLTHTLPQTLEHTLAHSCPLKPALITIPLHNPPYLLHNPSGVASFTAIVWVFIFSVFR